MTHTMAEKQMLGFLVILWLRERMNQLYAQQFLDHAWELADLCADGKRPLDPLGIPLGS